MVSIPDITNTNSASRKGKYSYKFNSESEYQEFLAKRQGYSRSEYNQQIAKRQGYATLYEYQEAKAQERGFSSYQKYLDHLAQEKNFPSYAAYQQEQQKKTAETIDAKVWGRVIREKSTEYALSRENLGKAIGVSGKTIERYATGKIIPSERTQQKIMHVLNISQETIDNLCTDIKQQGSSTLST